MRRALLPVVIAVLLGSGCIPERGNPGDPVNRPQPRLVIVDHVDGGMCSTDFADGRDWPAVGASRRSACLALDARGTTDPQEDRDALQFTFGTIDSAGGFTPLPAGAIDVPARAVATLRESFRGTFSNGEVVRFAVRVKDGAGGTAIAEASLVFVNQQPIARVAPRRVLPAGGYPWVPGEDFVLTFDPSRSSDPDGDLLEYCWTFPDTGMVCSTSAAAASFTRGIACEPAGVFRPTLIVRDGDLESAPVVADVQLRSVDPVVAASWFFAASTHMRLDGRSLEITLAGNDGTVQAVPIFRTEADGGSVMITLTQVSGSPQAREVSAASLDGTAGAPVRVAESTFKVDGRIAIAPGERRVHVIATDASGLRYQALDLPNQSLDLAQAIAPISIVTPDFGAAQRAMGVDTLGAVWFGDQDGLARIPPGGGPAQRIESRVQRQVATRPGSSGELWSLTSDGALEIRDPAAPAAAPLPLDTTLTPDATFSPTFFDFADAETVWVAFAGDGIRLLDIATLLVSGASAATITRYPTVVQPESEFVDAVTGELFVNLADEEGLLQLLSLVPSGGVEAHHYSLEGLYTEYALAVDASGAVWFAGLGGEYDVRTGRHPDRISDPRPQLGNSWGAMHDGEGGVWVATYVGPTLTLTHHASDGSILETLQGVDDDVLGRIPFPSDVEMGPIRGSPDGRHLWTSGDKLSAATAAIHRIDLASGARTTVLSGGEAQDRRLAKVFEPSAPLPASTPFVWTIDYYDRRASAVALDGTIAEKGTVIPGGLGGNLIASMSHATNDLCILHEDSGVFRTRRITPAGSESDLGGTTQFLAPNQYFRSVSASASACWSSVSENTNPLDFGPFDVRIHGWVSPNTVVHRWAGSLPGPLTSIVPESDERVHITWPEPDGTHVGTIEFTAGIATGGTLTLHAKRNYGGGVLLDPKSSTSFESRYDF